MGYRSQPRVVLAVCSLATFMASLDLFIVNVALPAIGRSFAGSPLPDLSWVLNGYAIVYAALLVPLGRLADRFGRKGGLLIGIALFTMASAACALSTSLWMLVSFRLLQAIGAAALTPTSLGLILPVFAPERRAGAVRIWMAIGALAAAVGPVAGGLLVGASWRWVFLVNLPIGVIALVAAARLVPDSSDPAVADMPDLVGAGILTGSLGLLALGLVELDTWPALRVALVLAAAIAGVGAFWARSSRQRSPVVEPALLKVRVIAWSNLACLLFSVAFAANLLAAILWMQQVWHYSALRTGLGIAPGPLMVPLFALVSGRLARHVPVGFIAAAGCLLFGTGTLLVSLGVGPAPDYAGALLPGWIVGGIGVGLALPTIQAAATASLPRERFATGAGIVNMSRQIGYVLGISVLVVALGAPHTYQAAHGGFVHAWGLIGIFAVIAALAAIAMAPRRNASDRRLAPEMATVVIGAAPPAGVLTTEIAGSPRGGGEER